jgi:hypothetical protein
MGLIVVYQTLQVSRKMDDPEEQYEQFEIIPDMIMAMRISDNEIVVYLSDYQRLTFSQLALDLLGDAIDQFRT